MDKPDLAKIVPEQVPDDAPDKQTAIEIREQKKPTLTEQLSQAHLQHVAELNGHVQFHRDECKMWKDEADSLRQQLLDEKDGKQPLVAKIARLEEIVASIGWVNAIGSILTIVGGIMVGIAGAMPSIPDVVRSGLTVGGSAFTICALALVALSVMLSRRAKS